ncbi:MAG TPA: DUF4013 domain-containing protein [Bacteroidota bacterium]|nr:DUF4013 domain-containing protein [Bacteroidota bacterium]
MNNFGEAFTFPFKDPNWFFKFLIGAIFVVLSFFLIGIPVLYGYCIELQQRVRRGEQYPLPEWKDVGVKFILGFKYLITLLIYYIPVFLILIPIVILLVVQTLNLPEIPKISRGMDSEIIFIVFLIGYSLLISLLSPIISVKFAEHEKIREGLDVGNIISLFGKHWQDTFIAILLGMGVGIFAVVGLLFFIVGIFFTTFYALVVRYHLFGQIGKNIYYVPETLR